MWCRQGWWTIEERNERRKKEKKSSAEKDQEEDWKKVKKKKCRCRNEGECSKTEFVLPPHRSHNADRDWQMGLENLWWKENRIGLWQKKNWGAKEGKETVSGLSFLTNLNGRESLSSQAGHRSLFKRGGGETIAGDNTTGEKRGESRCRAHFDSAISTWKKRNSVKQFFLWNHECREKDWYTTNQEPDCAETTNARRKTYLQSKENTMMPGGGRGKLCLGRVRNPIARQKKGDRNATHSGEHERHMKARNLTG